MLDYSTWTDEQLTSQKERYVKLAKELYKRECAIDTEVVKRASSNIENFIVSVMKDKSTETVLCIEDNEVRIEIYTDIETDIYIDSKYVSLFGIHIYYRYAEPHQTEDGWTQACITLSWSIYQTNDLIRKIKEMGISMTENITHWALKSAKKKVELCNAVLEQYNATI